MHRQIVVLLFRKVELAAGWLCEFRYELMHNVYDPSITMVFWALLSNWHPECIGNWQLATTFTPGYVITFAKQDGIANVRRICLRFENKICFCTCFWQVLIILNKLFLLFHTIYTNFIIVHSLNIMYFSLHVLQNRKV